MSTGHIIKHNEIMLYDTIFPIVGQVRRTAVTPFAPKFTLGDYSRETNIVTSSWITSSFAGGLGILDGSLPKDADRFWDSNLNTLYRYLVLNSLVHSGGTYTGPADDMQEYNDALYICAGTTVYKWNESTQEMDSIHTISATANAMAVFLGQMFIITDSGLHRFDAVSNIWYDYMSPDAYIPSGDSMVVWDGKLFRIGADPADSSVTKMFYTIDPDPNDDGISLVGDWVEAGVLYLARKDCRQLLIYFDLTGDSVIHAICKQGVYGYEFTSFKFFETPVVHPHTHTAGKGACVWRGELWVCAGRNVYVYNGSTIRVMSPAKDDGLPAHLRGDVIQMVPGHAFIYAVISAAAVGADPGIDMILYDPLATADTDTVVFEETPEIGEFPMGSVAQTGAVLVSSGSSWHSLFDTVSGDNIGYTYVASLGDTFRIWMSTSSTMNYVNLDTGFHNPLQNPDSEFRMSGFVETPWVDMGWVELNKLALSLDVDADGIDPVNGTTLSIDVAWDHNDSYSLLADITRNGLSRYSIEPDEGRIFKFVRLRIRMARAAGNINATPVLRSVVFGFMRRPPFLWGWEINLSLTGNKPKYGMTSRELIERLYEITERIPTVGRFKYRDADQGILQDHRVLVSNIQGAETTGSESSGRYTVSLIQMDNLDVDNT